MTHSTDERRVRMLAFAEIEQWCDKQRVLLADDDHDYKSGEEYGLRRAAIEAQKRASDESAHSATYDTKTHVAVPVTDAIRQAEAAAYERAAQVAVDYEGEDHGGAGYHSKLGDAERTKYDIAAAIRALAGGDG